MLPGIIVIVVIFVVVAIGKAAYSNYQNEQAKRNNSTTKPKSVKQPQQKKRDEYSTMKSSMHTSISSSLVDTFASSIDVSGYEQQENFYDNEVEGEFNCTCVDRSVFDNDLLYSNNVDEESDVAINYHLDNIATAIILGEVIGKRKSARRSRN